ncbi:membrane protein insertion efficiency factor YidD [Paraburkholderia sediminicola]|uniref:membrane protein insertion efficiency factor YidD n=1 Tax=Paraburkholderia sediminicola TaxID=458836 RepID=UPI0038BCB33A
MSLPSGDLISVSEEAIGVYRRFAPVALRNACLFEPTCSEYALRAIRKYGPFRGDEGVATNCSVPATERRDRRAMIR